MDVRKLRVDIETLNGRIEISVDELAAWRAAGGGPMVLDVREAHELAVSALAGAVHIPMGQIPARAAEVPSDVPVVVMCHHGARSMRVVQFLRQSGHANVVNLAGGIDAWSCEIDPAVPRY
jgi:rhodanese-related sulfurtransferase